MPADDRVHERRRAAALARHYRDAEGLSIREISRRLGRAEATVKAYLYDPSQANKRPRRSPRAYSSQPPTPSGGFTAPRRSSSRSASPVLPGPLGKHGARLAGRTSAAARWSERTTRRSGPVSAARSPVLPKSWQLIHAGEPGGAIALSQGSSASCGPVEAIALIPRRPDRVRSVEKRNM